MYVRNGVRSHICLCAPRVYLSGQESGEANVVEDVELREVGIAAIDYGIEWRDNRAEM